MFSKQLPVGLFRCCFEIRGFINISTQHCIYIGNKDKENVTETEIFLFLGKTHPRQITPQRNKSGMNYLCAPQTDFFLNIKQNTTQLALGNGYVSVLVIKQVLRKHLRRAASQYATNVKFRQCFVTFDRRDVTWSIGKQKSTVSDLPPGFLTLRRHRVRFRS